MDDKQLTFSNSLLAKVKASHKPYAKKILFVLYPNNSLSQFTILSKFPNKHSNIVKASIKDLEECNLITNTNKSESIESERLYTLTKHSKQITEKDNI